MEPASKRVLTVPVMIAYGTGSVAQGAVNVGLYSLLLFYYQQLAGLSGTLTGLALGIALAFDAISDPVVGGISDRVKGRFGRRHPMMAISALPLAGFVILLFSPPEGMSQTGSFLWLTTFTILVRTAMTFYSVPHLALGAEMAQDYHQRSTLFAYNMLIGGIGAMALSVSVFWLIFPTTEQFNPGLLDKAGYQIFGWSAAVVIVVALSVCVFGTAREIPYLREPEITTRLSIRHLFADMREVFVDRDFRVIFGGFVLWFMFDGIQMVGLPFMGLHFWGFETEELAYSGIAALAAVPVAFLLVPVLTRVFDKKQALILGSLAFIILPNLLIGLRLLDVSWYPGNDSPWVLVNYLLAYFLAVSLGAVCATTYSSIYADIADAHELRTGRRREGAIYSTQTFATKASGALGLILGGAVLDIIRFPQNAVQGAVPEDVIWNLGLLFGPGMGILSLFGIGLFFLYRMNKARHAEIVTQLNLRREQE